MSSKPHVIGKQVFEAEYNSVENGLVFRTVFTDFVKDKLLSVIEEVLDELSPKNALLRIEKLDLDLGNINYPFDEYTIREALRKKLKDELNFKIVSIRHKNPSHPEDAIISMVRTEEELLLFFFKEGYLPWWTSESEQFSVSLEQLMERLIEKKPKQVVRILEKIRKDSNQVKRFFYHTPEVSFYALLAFHSGIAVKKFEEVKHYFIQEGFSDQVVNFRMVLSEFFLQHFFVERKTMDSIEELRLIFSEYLLQQKEIKDYQLAELFPERYLSKWIEQNFPSFLGLFNKYITRISIHLEGGNRKKVYQILYESFLKHHAKEREELSALIAKDIEEHSVLVAQEIRKISGETTEESDASSGISEEAVVKNSPAYFDRLEKTILQYLHYGVIAWQDRAAGVRGIEKMILELHQKNPDKVAKLFLKIRLTSYPVVLARIENSLEKSVVEIILLHYFSKPAALEQLSAVQYRQKILKEFFVKGTALWSEVISNNVSFVEEIIIAFYEQEPDYFIRVLEESVEDHKAADFMRKVEFVFSAKLSAIIRPLLKEKEVKKQETTLPQLPSDVDLIVYYLSYFEKNRTLPAEVTFSLEELVAIFINQFPEESSSYFTMAAYSAYAILKQKFTPEITVKINRLITPEDEAVSIVETDKKRKEEEKIKSTNTDKKNQEKGQPEIPKEPIYISNAGLVLIHPFLQRFFSLCALLEKRKFKDKAASHKAVHLLQYIVAKGEKSEEHQLVLNKILCGIPLSEPVDRTIQLTDDEKETCESLIKGVVENWPILKKTSTDNFRVSLLQREGRLVGDDTTWKLKVEERSYDMLLDKLPWTISMIKLPWMEKVMHVEWR